MPTDRMAGGGPAACCQPATLASLRQTVAAAWPARLRCRHTISAWLKVNGSPGAPGAGLAARCVALRTGGGRAPPNPALHVHQPGCGSHALRDAKGDFIWYAPLTSDAGAAQRFHGDVVGWALHDSRQPAWLGDVAVPDVDAAVADGVGAGGTVQMPALGIAGVGRMATLADPDGVPLCVMGGAVDAPSTAIRVADARPVRRNETSVGQDAAALAVCNARFGWQSAGAMPMGGLGGHHVMAAGGATIGPRTAP